MKKETKTGGLTPDELRDRGRIQLLTHIVARCAARYYLAGGSDTPYSYRNGRDYGCSPLDDFDFDQLHDELEELRTRYPWLARRSFSIYPEGDVTRGGAWVSRMLKRGDRLLPPMPPAAFKIPAPP